MAITPEQARAELARRELAKRQSSQKPMFSSEEEGRTAIAQNLEQQKQLESKASPMGIAKTTAGQTAQDVVGGAYTAANTASVGGLDALMGLATGKSQLSQPGSAGYDVAQGAGTGIGMLVPMGMTGKAASTTIKAVDTDKIAGRVINSLIKPEQSAYALGMNPGKVVAKEKLVASSLPELKLKIDDRIKALSEMASNIRSTPENVDKVVDLTSAFDPLRRAHGMLSRAPTFHASDINKVKAAIKDLTSGDLKNVSISKAYEIKDTVSKMQNWKVASKAEEQVNTALRNTYRSIDKTIDRAIPELEGLNDRMANLITASQAAQHRANILMNQEAMPTVMRVLDLPFVAMKTPKAKTLLGALLAKRYSIVP